MPEKEYTIKMKSEAVVAIGFSDAVAARKFLAAVACLSAVGPEETDANDIVIPMRDHAKEFYISGRDEEAIRKIRED